MKDGRIENYPARPGNNGRSYADNQGNLAATLCNLTDTAAQAILDNTGKFFDILHQWCERKEGIQRTSL
jgi:hypothetical protein